MKIIFLILLLSIAVLSTTAQERLDKKVIVTVTDTAGIFKRVGLYLLEQGYTIESKYDDLQTLTTGAHPFKGSFAATYKVGVQVKGAELIVTGLTRLEIVLFGTQPSNYDPVDYRTNKGHLHRKVWEQMELIAKNFGTELKYSK